MTIREKFARRIKPLRILMWLGILTLVGGFLVNLPGGQPDLWLVVAGIVLFSFVSVWMQFFALRCPQCYGNCGPLIMQQASFIRVNDALKFCPYCGVGWDEELEPDEVPSCDQEF